MEAKIVELDSAEMVEQFEEMAKKEYVGEAGAGMVKVTVRADMIITKVEIDHTMFAKTVPELIENLDFLADLIKAATNQAIERGNEGLIQNLGEEILQRVLE